MSGEAIIGFVVMEVLLWWLKDVSHQNKNKMREMEAEPSSLSGTFLRILDPEILMF